MVLGLALLAVIVIGLSLTANAQSSLIPSWIKNTAKWWSEGQVGDSDFINGLQWLIDNNILTVSKKNESSIFGEKPILHADEGFSDLSCIQNYDAPIIITLNGHFTNGAIKKSLVEIFLGIVGQNKKIIGTGFTALTNLEPNESRLVLVTAYLNSEDLNFNAEVSGCEVKIGNKIES